MLSKSFRRSEPATAGKDASARIIKELVTCCPRCGGELSAHHYRLIAACVLRPDHLDRFKELLTAIQQNQWDKVLDFQEWEGSQANAEVFLIRCLDSALSAVVISAPFALEEPYSLMHQTTINDAPALLTGLDEWQLL